MIDLDTVSARYATSVEQVNQWAEKQYQKQFAKHFKDLDNLYNRLKSTNDPITDDELEHILTWLPIELVSVAEELSNLRNAQEVIKLEIRRNEDIRIKLFTKELGISETKAKEKAASYTVEDKLLLSVYDSIYERVSRQVSFAKELIMSSKKIWDARRNSEQSMPSIPEPTYNDSLPEYVQKPSTYIK